MKKEKIIVASKNPVKITATTEAFQALFPEKQFETIGISVPSGVSEQPYSDKETLMGALNRANAAHEAHLDAHFWVGIEGGVEEKGNEEMEAFAWIVARSQTMLGKGKSGTFLLPKPVADLIKGGFELGQADDIIFGTNNSKQNCGAVGILTKNVLNRTELYKAAAILALIPLRNTELYTPTHCQCGYLLRIEAERSKGHCIECGMKRALSTSQSKIIPTIEKTKVSAK